MKLSRIQGEDGFRDDQHFFYVTLNGREVFDVLRADEEAGYLDRRKHQFMRAEDCAFVRDSNVERLTGKVQILDARGRYNMNRT